MSEVTPEYTGKAPQVRGTRSALDGRGGWIMKMALAAVLFVAFVVAVGYQLAAAVTVATATRQAAILEVLK